MVHVPSKKVLAAALFGSLIFIGAAQASTNPFAEARPGSRLPTIAENASDKCAGSGAAQEKAASMPCGSAGKCSGSMLESAKPDETPAESSKCGGGSGSAKPASQCGGGK
jgi:hypothetical protein